MSVSLQRHDGWTEVVLDRPARRNAIDGPLGVALAEHLEALAGDAGVRVVVLRGAGGAFCSGLDVKAFNADPRPDWHADFPAIWRRVHRALYHCPQPVVTALERYAINGGAALALAGDLLISGRDAFLQVGEVQQGMAAPYNLAWLRLRHSEALAARIALVGRRFPGSELAALGVAHEAVADDVVLARAQGLAAELADFPPGALRRIKAGLRAWSEPDADAWFDRVFAADPAPAALAPQGLER